MNKLLLIPIILVAFFAVVFISQFLVAAQYGIMSAPGIVLLTPRCNSTVSANVAFSFEPKPTKYDHYLIQIRAGESWDVNNYLSITTNELNYSLTEPLITGIYQYNIIGLNANNESLAGSGPCRFIVE